jgi:hypothetical protein
MSSSDNAEWVLMDYVNVVVHVSKHKYANITISNLWGDMQNHCNSKQILKKRKRRMAKDNNPTPNKFKVSPWLVYRHTAYLFY